MILDQNSFINIFTLFYIIIIYLIFVNCPPHYDVGAVSSILSVSLRSSFVDMLSVRGQSSSISSLAIRTRVFNQAVDGRGEFSTPAEKAESKSCIIANMRNCFLLAQSRQYCNSFSGVSGYITFTWVDFCNNVGSAAQDFEVITMLAKVPAAECKWHRGGITLSCTRGPAFEEKLAAPSRKYMSAALC